LIPFFFICSTNIKRFAEKLATLGRRVDVAHVGVEGRNSWTIS
jgi:hypothetical protein